ncbi:glycosyltransferase [Dysgonomonas sp. OttesenSCG-928-M03]|nr:glycosyltransferase [Dysgonomonas sp. OttesenSCG-928-M03]
MNKISIITVNRNNAQGLKKTILSVIAQTYHSFEFIIIDGASTDNSIDVIQEYANHISYWVSEKDTGIFNAMNKGIKQASGDYCYFLNSADSFMSESVLHDIFHSKEYTAPFINGNQINDFGTHTQRVSHLNRTLTLYDFYWGTIKHQATFIRRDMFDKYGLYDENLRITADWKFFLQTIGLHNEQPVFVNTDIVNFEWNGMSTNPESDQQHQSERRKVLDECIPKSIQADYERLHLLNNYSYIMDAMKKSSFLNKTIRGLVKIFK